MSLILDALNKADRERDPRDSVPDINTVHGGVRQPVDQRRLLWIAGSLGAVTVILAMLLLVLWLRQSPAVPEQQTESLQRAPSQSQPNTQQVVEAAAAQPPLQTPATTTIETAPASLVVNPEVQALYGVQTDPVVMQVVEPEVRAAPPVIVPEARRQTTVDEALAQSLWEKSKTQPPPVQKPSPPAKKKAPAPPALDPDLPLEETMAGHPKTPFLHELPVTLQDTIPTLMYAKHDYENRKVVINKTELRMGDATNGGVLVEQVLADGVLLSFNGAEFKLGSLSSWVNY